ncbi:P-selectin glycoprotein ligand 1 isoform X2 [Sander lucioperca]|uniref:P-selectin glycoprotein ligand 1 isoform X2 n=1 Tax=Sander lucioperca TaxID=283035 RepID=UPI00125D222D|nr:P-selectin glycoprotein ligand 1 isoform X2 [Sander lucioperca]
MGLLSMKMNLALLWGISVLFAMESMSAFIPNTNSTAEPDKTTAKLISSSYVLHPETQKPAEISVAAPAETTVSPTVETKEAIITDRSDSTSGLVAMNTVATTTSSSGPPLLHISTAVTTTAGATHPSNNTTISETAKPTEDHIRQQSPSTSTDTTAPATASAASTTKPEVTSKLSSTTSPANSSPSPVFTQTLSSPSPSTTAITIANPTSEAAPVFDPTTSETSTTSTELSSTSQPVSVTKIPISTTGSSSTAEPPNISFTTDSPIPTTNVSTTNVSTSPAGILIPRVSKRLPNPTTKSNRATTTAPREVSKSPLSTEAQPCSTRGVVKNCLIVIASLAALATAFIVSTVILCAKLSTRKYKVKKTSQPATEMMCISALLPERNYTYSRQRNPVTNGVLVIHGGADSDEDGGDNLTLSSFLPENDRFV